MNAFAVMGR